MSLSLTRDQAQGVAVATEAFRAATQLLQRKRLRYLAVLEKASLVPCVHGLAAGLQSRMHCCSTTELQQAALATLPCHCPQKSDSPPASTWLHMRLQDRTDACTMQGYADQDPFGASSHPCSAALAATEQRLVWLRGREQAAHVRLITSIFGPQVSPAAALPAVSDSTCRVCCSYHKLEAAAVMPSGLDMQATATTCQCPALSACS